MTKKVSLKEIVGTKIIYAIIMATYYWMWARTDWKDYYETIQTTLTIFTVAFLTLQTYRIQKYKKEGIDEMAEQNLKRCDAICLKLFITVMIITAWICALFNHSNTLSTSFIGWIIVLSIVFISILRTVLFMIMDKKGV